MTMAHERLSRLQYHILTWLLAEDLVRALVPWGFDNDNVSTSLKGLAAKGLVTITRTPGGRAEVVDLTAAGRNRATPLTESCA
jgi:hypothetical protein